MFDSNAVPNRQDLGRLLGELAKDVTSESASLREGVARILGDVATVLSAPDIEQAASDLLQTRDNKPTMRVDGMVIDVQFAGGWWAQQALKLAFRVGLQAKVVPMPMDRLPEARRDALVAEILAQPNRSGVIDLGRR